MVDISVPDPIKLNRSGTERFVKVIIIKKIVFGDVTDDFQLPAGITPSSPLEAAVYVD